MALRSKLRFSNQWTRLRLMVTLSLGCLCWHPPANAAQIEAVLTADNGYGLGLGTESELVTYFGTVENLTAGQIFNGPLGNGPEAYTITDAAPNDYLYVVAWSDDQVTQGVLGQFRVGAQSPLYTGEGPWEVFATGIDFDVPSGGPSLESINAQIAIANAGSDDATTSGTWVGTEGGIFGNLAFGEDNSAAGGEFQLAAILDADAHWMWFSRDAGLNPFRDGNHKEYLIFRLPVREIPGVVETAFGLEHTGLGNANVAGGPDASLTVTGTGQDYGVSVHFDPSLEWSSTWAPTTVDEGEVITHLARGTAGGTADRALGRMDVVKTPSKGDGKGRFSLTTDFSSVGYQDFRIVLTDGADLVLDEGGFEFTSNATEGALRVPGDPIPDVDIVLEQVPGGEIAGGTQFGTWTQEGPGAVSGRSIVAPWFALDLGARTDVVFDGVSYTADRVQIIGQAVAGDPTALESITAMEVMATAAIPSFTWIAEGIDAGVLFSSVPVQTLGNAEVKLTESGLEIRGFGDSGSDGTSVLLGRATSGSLEGIVIDTGEPVLPGATLEVSAFAAGPGDPLKGTAVSTSTTIFDGVDWTTEVDYSLISGTSTGVYEVLRNGAKVAEATLSITAKMLHDTAMNTIRKTRASPPRFEAEWDEPTLITLPGQVPVMADELRVTPENPLFEPDAFSALEVRGADISTLGVGQISTSTATCIASSTKLCLNDDRFAVEVEWETPNGDRGDGRAQEVTADTGYFWFFNQENVEMVVKVLSGCHINGRFWVFAGGLTNVEVQITVTDTESGTKANYDNPQRTPFQPIQDTDALPCESNSGAAGSFSWTLDAEPSQLTVSTQETQGQTLLLNDDRFLVEVEWETSTGASGAGVPVELTSDTGYFWFFNQNNVEIVVKILRACGFNNRYWVFAGGLTNVAVSITVTDTETGAEMTYENPLGLPFQPIQDTDAFATCP